MAIRHCRLLLHPITRFGVPGKRRCCGCWGEVARSPDPLTRWPDHGVHSNPSDPFHPFNPCSAFVFSFCPPCSLETYDSKSLQSVSCFAFAVLCKKRSHNFVDTRTRTHAALATSCDRFALRPLPIQLQKR